MSRRADEADVASTVRQSNIRLVGPAQPAAHPYKPNVPLNLALGMFGGLALAIGYVMLQEQTNSALRAPGDAGAYLTLPELGAIPKAEKRRFAALGFLGAQQREIARRTGLAGAAIFGRVGVLSRHACVHPVGQP